MERRKFIAASLLAVSTTGIMSCSKSSQENEEYGPIIHSVYFWLKEDITDKEKIDFINFFEALRGIEAIQTLRFGQPAPANPRPVVDNSFSYNLIVTFSNMENLNIYENHPDHLAAIEKYQQYWTKVEVRDTTLI
ncbi:Dabb family protein [Sphingobacterium rhinopitheci]|uniref:Dabb family protein n=1 Tax=Sphingobacterium rhinopitheci TaxID=2781960 RepID=UPI001F521700|nr:Dabb family protein [Sphingobacterium rhinopitheci]MCI0921383.1 Dabb family protein [Sphingobacterium rhinopitheci]